MKTQFTGPTRRRRGVAAVAAVALLVVLLGFAALAVDVGHLYVAKGDLQRAADAAALAGASAFTEDSLRELAGGDQDLFYELAADEARTRAAHWCWRNKTTGVNPVLEDADIVVGWYDPADPTAALVVGGKANAVQVTGRFTRQSQNGPVSNFFATVMGFADTDVSATATAAFDTHFDSYTPRMPGVLIPFTIHVDEYDDQVLSGPDEFGYDEDLDLVQNFPDSTPEVVLYPYKFDPGGPDGAGNFGILNVGTENQGGAALSDQIIEGITQEDVEAETGVPHLTFLDADNNPTTYQITGTPGVTGGLEAAIEARVGDVVGFFLHNNLVDPGSNAVYTIVRLEFGQIMEVELSGNPDNRRLRIQPVLYTDPGVGTDPDAPDDGEVGRVILVR